MSSPAARAASRLGGPFAHGLERPVHPDTGQGEAADPGQGQGQIEVEVAPPGPSDAGELENTQDLTAVGDLEEDRPPVVGPGIVRVEPDDPVHGRAFGTGLAGEGFDRMVDGLLGREHDAKELQDTGLGILDGLDVRHRAEKPADPRDVADPLAEDGHAVRVLGPEQVRAPGENEPAQGQPEVIQTHGLDVAGQAEKTAEGLQLAVGHGIHARVEQNDLAGDGAEEGLGGLAVGGPAGLQVLLPIPEPSREDRQRPAMEEPIEEALIGDPFEALAFLLETAGRFEAEILGGPGQTIASDQADRAAFFAAGVDGARESRPPGLSQVAADAVGQENGRHGNRRTPGRPGPRGRSSSRL